MHHADYVRVRITTTEQGSWGLLELLLVLEGDTNRHNNVLDHESKEEEELVDANTIV
jgi:hypothetical protein